MSLSWSAPEMIPIPVRWLQAASSHTVFHQRVGQLEHYFSAGFIVHVGRDVGFPHVYAQLGLTGGGTLFRVWTKTNPTTGLRFRTDNKLERFGLDGLSAAPPVRVAGSGAGMYR